jgi:hypothetical protein
MIIKMSQNEQNEENGNVDSLSRDQIMEKP